MIANMMIPELTGEEFTRLVLALFGVIGTLITIGGGIVLQLILSRQKVNTAVAKAVEAKVDAMTDQNKNIERKVDTANAVIAKTGEASVVVVNVPPKQEGGSDSAKS